jgi:hypothetical protein
MRLTSIKNPLHIQTAQKIPIDEIISFVSKLDYCIDIKNKDLNPEESKIKKTKNVEQIKKENIALLSEYLFKLKDISLNQDESRVTKIKELYDLLKTKLGNDSYLLNISIVVKILHGNLNINTNLLNPSFKILLDIILTDVDTELKNLLSNVDYTLLTDLLNHETEPSLLQIINSDQINKTKEENTHEVKKNLSLIYLFIILKNYSRKNFQQELFIIELALAEHFIDVEKKDLSNYLLKILPEAMLDNNYKTKIKSIIHLYLIDNNNHLKKTVDRLADKVDQYSISALKLSDELKELKEEGKIKDHQISQLTQDGIEKANEINNLQVSLTQKTDRLEYEVNLYQKQLDELEAEIISTLNRDLRLEIDSLTAIANRLEPSSSESLNMSIANIKQILNTLNI